MRGRKKDKLSEFPHNGTERRISTETSHRLMRSMLSQKQVASTGPRWPVIAAGAGVVGFFVISLLVQVAC